MALTVVSRGRKFTVERDPAWGPGRYRYTATIHDQHYHDGAQWQAVDESLSDDTAEGFTKACTKTAHILRVGNGGTRRWYPRRNVPTEYVDITAIEYWRTTGGGSWRALNLPTPVWRAQGADWDLANLSASLTNTWRQVKAAFVLKDSTAPTRLRFALTLTGLTLGADWSLTSAADGTVVGQIDPPTAWYGATTEAMGAPLPITATYTGGYVEWAVNTTGATFPVYVDPTLTDGSGSTPNSATDTYLNAWSATTNYGTGVSFQVRADSGVHTYPGLMKFDLSGISAGATCDDAHLTLTNVYALSLGTTYTIVGFAVKSANSGWTEDGATWNTKDGTNNWAGDATAKGCSVSGTDYDSTTLWSDNWTRPPDGANTSHTINVTAGGKSVIAGYFGGAFSVLLQQDVDQSLFFHSAENGTAGYCPKLEVDYTAAGGTTAVPVFLHHYAMMAKASKG